MQIRRLMKQEMKIHMKTQEQVNCSCKEYKTKDTRNPNEHRKYQENWTAVFLFVPHVKTMC